MKNKKLNILILLLAITLVLFFTLKSDFNGIINQLLKTNVLIFATSVLIFLLSILFKAASLRTFIKECKPDYSLKNAYQLTLIGQFLNGITPFQSGGQPFQVYLLRKEGVRITDSTRAMIKDFVSFQLALIMMGIFAIIANLTLGTYAGNNNLKWLILIGFAVNIIVLIFLFLVCVAKNTGTKIINKLIDVVFRFKIVNKLGITKEKAKESLKHFYETSEDLKDNKLLIIKAVIYNVIHLVLLYVIPWVIFHSLGSQEVTVMASIIGTSFVMLIGNFIPIPGATGGIEYGFIRFFGSLVKGPILSGAMLLWRGVTYFFGILIGAITLLMKKERNEK